MCLYYYELLRNKLLPHKAKLNLTHFPSFSMKNGSLILCQCAFKHFRWKSQLWIIKIGQMNKKCLFMTEQTKTDSKPVNLKREKKLTFSNFLYPYSWMLPKGKIFLYIVSIYWRIRFIIIINSGHEGKNKPLINSRIVYSNDRKRDQIVSKAIFGFVRVFHPFSLSKRSYFLKMHSLC